MPFFQFEALDPQADTRRDQIQAANAEAAASMLRAKGLFVTKLTEVPQFTENGTSPRCEDVQRECVSAPDNVADRQRLCLDRRWGLTITAVGLICVATGLYGVVESAWLGSAANHTQAKVVDHYQASEEIGLLEFTAAGRKYRVPARGAWGICQGATGAVGTRMSVLYHAERPEDARLASFNARFAAPLIALVSGLTFTTCGLLIPRR